MSCVGDLHLRMRKPKSPVLRPHEEEAILKDVIGKAERGEPVLREDVINRVIEFIQSDMRKNPFRDGKPGDKWFSLFRRRHDAYFMLLTPEQLMAVENVGFTVKVTNTIVYPQRTVKPCRSFSFGSPSALVVPVIRKVNPKNSTTPSITLVLRGNLAKTEDTSPMIEESSNTTATDDGDAKSEEGMNDSNDFQPRSKRKVMDFNQKWVNIEVEDTIRTNYESRKPKSVESSHLKSVLGRKRKMKVDKPIRRRKRRRKKVFDESTYEYLGPKNRHWPEEDPERWNMEIPEGVSPVQIRDDNGFSRVSVIIPDKNLPLGWTKHTIRRKNKAKWDVILRSPGGRNLRSRNELRSYFAELKQPFPEECFDFKVGRKMEMIRRQNASRDKLLQGALPEDSHSPEHRKTDGGGQSEPKKPSGELDADLTTRRCLDQEDEKVEQSIRDSSALSNLVSLPSPFADPRNPDGGFTCCGKTFRKENIFKMHVKHYHPEYSDLLGYTPTVEDLAYTRTFVNFRTRKISQAEAMAPSIEPVDEYEAVLKDLTDLAPAFVEIPRINIQEEEPIEIEVLEKDPLSPIKIKKEEPVEIEVLEKDPLSPIEIKKEEPVEIKVLKEEPISVEEDVTEDNADIVLPKQEEKTPIGDEDPTVNNRTKNTVVEPPSAGQEMIEIKEIKIETPEEKTEELPLLLGTPEEPNIVRVSPPSPLTATSRSTLPYR